jgi:hypothetical protein
MIELMGFKFFFSFQFCDNKKKLVIFFPQKISKISQIYSRKKKPNYFFEKKEKSFDRMIE